MAVINTFMYIIVTIQLITSFCLLVFIGYTFYLAAKYKSFETGVDKSVDETVNLFDKICDFYKKIFG